MPATRQGTGFINFSDFVNANRSGAERVANALQSPYTTDLQRADGGLRSAQEEFGRNMAAGTFDGNPSRQRTAAELGEANAYTGPEGLAGDQNYDSGLASARHAEEGAKRLAGTYGRMGLLQDFYGTKSPTYSSGQRAFDSALLGAVGQRGFEDTRKSAGSMLERFASADSQARQQAATARTTGRQNQLNYLGNLEQQAGGYYGYGGYGPPVAPPRPSTQTPPPQGPGNQLGTVTVPAPAPQTGPVTVGTTEIAAPTAPTQGGRWIGGQWVPYT